MSTLSTNDITGDRIITKASTKAYRNSPFWDMRKKKVLCNGDDVFPIAFPLKETKKNAN